MTKVFDFIHSHGCRIAERRAQKAHADLADRERRRKEEGGDNTVLMASGDPDSDLTLDSWFADMGTERNYRPWWHKVTLHIHWWLGNHGPRATFYDLKHKLARAKRGWSYRDAWGFHDYLGEVIRDGALYLDKIKHGHPTTVTFEEWGEILNKIAEGMQAGLDLSRLDYEWRDKAAEKALQDKHDEAMDLLKKHWFSLWD